MAKKKAPPAGAPIWLVTFADLLAAVLAFFVILAAYSTMDNVKLQIVAGSMREAFGNNPESRLAGLIELDGIPTKARLANAKQRPLDEASDTTGPTLNDRADRVSVRTTSGKPMSRGAASLRQALNSMPDVAEVSKNIMLEDTDEGVKLSLVDQDGRSMFAEGSIVPFDRVRRVLETIAPTIKSLPHRIAVTGHTSSRRAGQSAQMSAWDLSTGRAGYIRELLAGTGLPDDRFAGVTGKADTEPMFPDNPFLAANRRVTITLINEAPALPPGLKP